MILETQRTLASSVLNIGRKRVWLDPERMEEIKEALTRDDIRKLISNGLIRAKQEKGVSRGRARATLKQKRKGRRKGIGSRKGKTNVRQQLKRQWLSKIRLQRELFQQLKDKKLISISTYRLLRQKSKGGYFRSPRHVKLFLTERSLWQKAQQ